MNIVNSNNKFINTLLKRINETYEKNGFVNINEIESTTPKGRLWIRGQNKTKEINIGIGIDWNYSIMDSQKEETKLRFHIAVVDRFPSENMIKIYTLRERIRNDVEFNFYNAKKVETDLKGAHPKGNSICSKILLPELLPDDVERLIMFDVGDLLVLRDLSEMYNWDMKNKTYCGIVDPQLGRYGVISQKPMDIYINFGNYLIDVKRVKNVKIYEKMVENKNAYHSHLFEQDLLNDVAYGKIGYLPMRFGIISLFWNDKSSDKPPYNTAYKNYNLIVKEQYKQIYHFLPKDINEMNAQTYNPVVIHQWNGKWMDGIGLTIYRRIAQYYIKYAGIWNEMCEKYPGYCKK